MLGPWYTFNKFKSSQLLPNLLSHQNHQGSLENFLLPHSYLLISMSDKTQEITLIEINLIEVF